MATSAAVDPKTPSRTRMIVVLGVMVALGPLTIDMYLPALPKIADDLSVSRGRATKTPSTIIRVRLGVLGSTAADIAMPLVSPLINNFLPYT